MFCPQCGNQNAEGAQICTRCGKELPTGRYVSGSGDGAATASLICGVVGIFFFGIVLGIIAITQGRKAKKLGYTGGTATAGIILGIIGLAEWALLILFIVLGIAAFASVSHVTLYNNFL